MDIELETQGWKTEKLKGLYAPPYGFFRKPNGEIGRLPADASRIQDYRQRGFEFLGLVGEVDPFKPTPEVEQRRRAGRPKGSRNKPKKKRAKALSK